MEAISPSITGLRLNCRRCGSSRAPKNPIDALVAIIPSEHTKMLGIFNNVSIDAVKVEVNIRKVIKIDFKMRKCSTQGSCIGK